MQLLCTLLCSIDLNMLLFKLNILHYRICTYLEPLAIAANITQGTFCRLDQVALTFASLAVQYSNANMEEDLPSRNSILASLEKHWMKADQEVFLAAIMVNPFYQMAPFRHIRRFMQANMTAMLTRVYRQLFREGPPDEFQEHLVDFFDRKGYFRNLAAQVDDALNDAAKKVCYISTI